MQIKQWLQEATLHLSRSVDTPALDAELLLAQLLNIERTYLLTHGECELSSNYTTAVNTIVAAAKSR